MAGKGREIGRVKIQWITDHKKRARTLKRRLTVVVKKTEELSVLCGVPVCLVAYRPGEAEPVVWPSPGAAADVVRRYRVLKAGPGMERFRSKLDSTEYAKQKNDKVRAKISNVERKTREVAIKNVMFDCLVGRRGGFDDMSTDFFVSFGMKVQDKLQAIKTRLQQIRSEQALLPAAGDVQMVEPLAVMQPLESVPMVATPLLQNDVAMTPLMLEPPFLQNDVAMTPLMLEPSLLQNDVAMTPLMLEPPLLQNDVAMTTLMLEPSPPQHDGPTPMTLDGEPRHGSYLFEMLDAFNDPGDGSALPSTEEMHAIFVQAGIFSPPLPNPSFDL